MLIFYPPSALHHSIFLVRYSIFSFSRLSALRLLSSVLRLPSSVLRPLSSVSNPFPACRDWNSNNYPCNPRLNIIEFSESSVPSVANFYLWIEFSLRSLWPKTSLHHPNQQNVNLKKVLIFMNFCQKSWIFPKFIEIFANFCSFPVVFWRIILAYTTQSLQTNAPIPIFDPKTRVAPKINKKNLKNPKFPPIFKIPFLMNVNLRKIMNLNFDFQPNVLYALKWCTVI